ncbi:hypothetical protein [Patulibacter minatonensis]|uniref:hypothetical protein n=1 Tax=Patulibacter minatonensis TaxID=298163 RepID=UPI00047EFD93|nr:hypothetical protein [Patulibacter minatonensis]
MLAPTIRRTACGAALAAVLSTPILAAPAGAAAPFRATNVQVHVVADGKRYGGGDGRVCQDVDVTITARFNTGVAYAEVATKGFVPTEGMRAVSGRTVFRLTSRYGRIVCVARRGQTGEALRKTLKARSASGQTLTKVLPRIRWIVR